MKKLNALLWAFAVSVPVSLSAHAASPEWHSVDASGFDIAEVKLGMDYDQALAAAAKHFQIPLEQFKVRCGTNPVTRTKLPRAFSYEADGNRLTVYLKVRIPADDAQNLTPSDLVVSEIQYRLGAKDVDQAALKNAVLDRYSAQSYVDSENGLHWCAEHLFGKCDPHQIELTFRNSSLDLKDPSYEAAIRKYREDAKASATNL